MDELLGVTYNVSDQIKWNSMRSPNFMRKRVILKFELAAVDLPYAIYTEIVAPALHRRTN